MSGSSREPTWSGPGSTGEPGRFDWGRRGWTTRPGGSTAIGASGRAGSTGWKPPSNGGGERGRDLRAAAPAHAGRAARGRVRHVRRSGRDRRAVHAFRARLPAGRVVDRPPGRGDVDPPPGRPPRGTGPPDLRV